MVLFVVKFVNSKSILVELGRNMKGKVSTITSYSVVEFGITPIAKVLRLRVDAAPMVKLMLEVAYWKPVLSRYAMETV